MDAAVLQITTIHKSEFIVRYSSFCERGEMEAFESLGNRELREQCFIVESHKPEFDLGGHTVNGTG